MKTIELKTQADSGAIQSTKIDNSTEYKDYEYTINGKTLIVKNYTDENSVIFEINGVAIFGEHLELLKRFINQ